MGHGFNFHVVEQIILGKQVRMSSDNSYVIRTSDATNRLIVNQNGNTTIAGNLNVGVSASSSKIKTHFNDSGYVGHMQMEAKNKADGFFTLSN